MVSAFGIRKHVLVAISVYLYFTALVFGNVNNRSDTFRNGGNKSSKVKTNVNVRSTSQRSYVEREQDSSKTTGSVEDSSEEQFEHDVDTSKEQVAESIIFDSDNTCSRSCLEKEERKKVTVEAIKKNILTKLGLERPPEISTKYRHNGRVVRQMLRNGLMKPILMKEAEMQGDEPFYEPEEEDLQWKGFDTEGDDFHVFPKTVFALAHTGQYPESCHGELPGQMGTKWGRTYHGYSFNKLCLPWSNVDNVGENISQLQNAEAGTTSMTSPSRKTQLSPECRGWDTIYDFTFSKETMRAKVSKAQIWIYLRGAKYYNLTEVMYWNATTSLWGQDYYHYNTSSEGQEYFNTTTTRGGPHHVSHHLLPHDRRQGGNVTRTDPVVDVAVMVKWLYRLPYVSHKVMHCIFTLDPVVDVAVMVKWLYRLPDGSHKAMYFIFPLDPVVDVAVRVKWLYRLPDGSHKTVSVSSSKQQLPQGEGGWIQINVTEFVSYWFSSFTSSLMSVVEVLDSLDDKMTLTEEAEQLTEVVSMSIVALRGCMSGITHRGGEYVYGSSQRLYVRNNPQKW
uniref:Uncharacterized protein n=1 Tax=Timema cristinae TaxID=61476 RepID=A0A7R9D1E1_TIMCR|nr:unnamed protein product [Timema cristinae]